MTIPSFSSGQLLTADELNNALDDTATQAVSDVQGQANTWQQPQTFGSSILQAAVAGALNQSPLLNAGDGFSDFIASGMQWAIPSSASLTTSMSSGVAYLNGVRTLIDAISSYTFPASNDTYVSFNNSGTVDYQSVANGATAPTPNSGYVQTAKVVTSPIQSPMPTLVAGTSGSLAAGTYQVALVAYDATGYGSVGASGSVTVAASGSIEISWVNPLNETSMDIYATTAGSTTLGLVASGVTGTSYTYTGSVAPGAAAPTTATSNAVQNVVPILPFPSSQTMFSLSPSNGDMAGAIQSLAGQSNNGLYIQNGQYIPINTTTVFPPNYRITVNGLVKLDANANSSVFGVQENTVIDGLGVIDGNAAGNPTSPGNVGVLFNANNVGNNIVVKDITIQNSFGWNINFVGGGNGIDAPIENIFLDNVKIINSSDAAEFSHVKNSGLWRSTIKDGHDYGFCFYGSVSYSWACHNYFSGGVGYAALGCLSDTGQPDPCVGNIFSGNIVAGAGNNGIAHLSRITGSPHLDIITYGNYVTNWGSGSYGVSLDNVQGGDISFNNISYGPSGGIVVLGSSLSTRVSSNIIKNINGPGLIMDGTVGSLLIEGNYFIDDQETPTMTIGIDASAAPPVAPSLGLNYFSDSIANPSGTDLPATFYKRIFGYFGITSPAVPTFYEPTTKTEGYANVGLSITQQGTNTCYWNGNITSNGSHQFGFVNDVGTTLGTFFSIYGDVAGISTGYNNTGWNTAWNFTDSQGELDLLLGPQGGAGGLNIYQLNSSGSMVSTTPIVAISNTGTVTTQGSVNVEQSTTINAPTSGSVTLAMPLQGSGGKQVVLTFDAYENDTTTSQTIDFPTAFSVAPLILGNNTGLTLTASTTGVTIAAPDSTTTYSGTAVIMGN